MKNDSFLDITGKFEIATKNIDRYQSSVYWLFGASGSDLQLIHNFSIFILRVYFLFFVLSKILSFNRDREFFGLTRTIQKSE